MAEVTEKGFNIPNYTDTADIPGMVRDNINNAEGILSEINQNLSDLSANISSFELTLAVMNQTLGAISDELDEVNGVNEEA